MGFLHAQNGQFNVERGVMRTQMGSLMMFDDLCANFGYKVYWLAGALKFIFILIL